MDPPSYVDVEQCENENDGTKDRGDDFLESWDPGEKCRRGWRGGKCGICLCAVVGLDVGRRC